MKTVTLCSYFMLLTANTLRAQNLTCLISTAPSLQTVSHCSNGISALHLIQQSYQENNKSVIETLSSIFKKLAHDPETSFHNKLLKGSIPNFNTNIGNYSISFSELQSTINDSYNFMDVNVFECVENFQITISKYMDFLNISGHIRFLNEINENNRFAFGMKIKEAIVSNVSSWKKVNKRIVLQIVNSDEATITYKYSETQFVKTKKANTAVVLASIPPLLEHIDSHFREKLNAFISAYDINYRMPYLDDFECLNSNVSYYSIQPITYLIEKSQRVHTRTNTLSVGPAVINNFLSIAKFAREYTWQTSRIKTIISADTLYITSDWNATSYWDDIFITEDFTGIFKMSNLRLIKINRISQDYRKAILNVDDLEKLTNYGCSNKACYGVELKISVNEGRPSFIGDMLCENLEKLVTAPLVDFMVQNSF